MSFCMYIKTDQLLSQVTSFANYSEFSSGICSEISMQKEHFRKCFLLGKKKEIKQAEFRVTFGNAKTFLFP